MNRIIKILFVLLVVRPVVLILLGLNVQNRNKLPLNGPAIIAANHNSHLDTMVVFSLYPLLKVHKLRPVAAADYFLSNPLLAWFSTNVIGIIPLSRSGRRKPQELFAECHEAIDNGDILILFPEGTRGKPEEGSTLKRGIFHLLKERPATPIIPLVTHGLGRALPKGEALLVPFNCDIVIGDTLVDVESSTELLAELTDSYAKLLNDCLTYNTTDEI